MEFLGLIYGISAVLVFLLVPSTARAAVEYRSVGIRRRDVLRGAVVILLLTLAWSGAAVGLLTQVSYTPNAALPVPLEHAVLTLLPVLVGWGPGLLLLSLGAGHTDGTLNQVPRWARWMDALWTA